MAAFAPSLDAMDALPRERICIALDVGDEMSEPFDARRGGKSRAATAVPALRNWVTHKHRLSRAPARTRVRGDASRSRRGSARTARRRRRLMNEGGWPRRCGSAVTAPPLRFRGDAAKRFRGGAANAVPRRRRDDDPAAVAAPRRPRPLGLSAAASRRLRGISTRHPAAGPRPAAADATATRTRTSSRERDGGGPDSGATSSGASSFWRTRRTSCSSRRGIGKRSARRWTSSRSSGRATTASGPSRRSTSGRSSTRSRRASSPLRGRRGGWTGASASLEERARRLWYVRRVGISLMNRDGAAAATWTFRGDASRRRRGCESRRRRGRDADISWRQVAAAPRLRRGYFVETRRLRRGTSSRLARAPGSRRRPVAAPRRRRVLLRQSVHPRGAGAREPRPARVRRAAEGRGRSSQGVFFLRDDVVHHEGPDVPVRALVASAAPRRLADRGPGRARRGAGRRRRDLILFFLLTRMPSSVIEQF